MSVLAVVFGLVVSAFWITPGARASDDETRILVPEHLLAGLASQVEVVGRTSAGWVIVIPRPGLRAAGAIPGTVADRMYELATDPLVSSQWWYENTGQTGGTPDADIDASAGLEISPGSPDQVIAVIDSGVDLDHPDLVDRLWVNSGEIPANGVDDDGNGHIDDVGGWDWVDEDNDPSPLHSHGTAVASAAAASLNGVGMVGVAPEATIMPLRVCHTTACTLSRIVSAIDYAVSNGATVINLSLGTTGYDQPLFDAVAAAGDADIVVTAAAGNSSTDNDAANPFYPASFDLDHIISVAATDHNDELGVWSGGGSNYGTSSVDLAAPGKDVAIAIIDGWSATGTGTSFASPMVAGTAALVRGIRTDLSALDVKELILTTTDSIATLSGKVTSGGRLNAGAAAIQATAPVAIASASPTIQDHPATFSLDGSSSWDNGSIVSYEWAFPDGTTDHSASTVWGPGKPGTYDVSLTVTDDDGLSDTATISVRANGLPTAVASGSPVLGMAPLEIQLSGSSSSDPEHLVAGWEWTMPIGTVHGEEAVATIHDRGVHSITLTVTDDVGATDSDEMTVLVGADFVDSRDSIFHLDIAWLSAVGATNGCNPPDNDQFCPDTPVNRGQAAAFLARVLDLPPSGSDHFVDDDGSMFEDAINRVAGAGILKGCNPPANNSVCPTTALTRAQLAAILVRALGLPTTTADPFVDDDGSVFEQDINRLAAAGLTKGCNPPESDRYCPDSTVTRGQLAAFLHRAGMSP